MVDNISPTKGEGNRIKIKSGLSGVTSRLNGIKSGYHRIFNKNTDYKELSEIWNNRLFCSYDEFECAVEGIYNNKLEEKMEIYRKEYKDRRFEDLHMKQVELMASHREIQEKLEKAVRTKYFFAMAGPLLGATAAFILHSFF